ncbi:MAG: hypothetical protein RIQ52_632, partial [Pseudomonadota bacterium]
PVSLNQQMGNYFNRYTIALDRAFLQYDAVNEKGFDWGSVLVGRTPNPYFKSTSLVWYDDVSFEGFSTSLRYDISDLTGENKVDIAAGQRQAVFATAGVHPIQNINFNGQSKWLLGLQSGIDYAFSNDSALKTSLAYYDYNNIEGQPDVLGSTENDWTAPVYMQKGNSLFVISDYYGNVAQPNNPRLVGLASKFQILSVDASYDYAQFAPTHLVLGGSWANNLGFNQQEILQRTGQNISAQTNAWQITGQVGRKEIRRFGDWRGFLTYRYIERDAVIDAYTDSNFHLGGTNAKGWVFGGEYGLYDNVWGMLRYFNTEQITNEQTLFAGQSAATTNGPFNINTVQLDLNARF